VCSGLSNLDGKIVYLITDCKGKWISRDPSIVGRQGQKKWEKVIQMQGRIRLQVLCSAMGLKVS